MPAAAILALQVALMVFQSLPPLIDAAERAFSHKSGTGPAKKAVVMEAVRTGLAVANTAEGKPLITPEHASLIEQAAGGLVDTMVAIARAAGWSRPAETTAP